MACVELVQLVTKCPRVRRHKLQMLLPLLLPALPRLLPRSLHTGAALAARGRNKYVRGGSNR